MGLFKNRPDKPLDDDSLMPFGKHKGVRMGNVPASYLHWYWTEAGGENNHVCPVAKYIRDNLTVLMTENKDLIWD